MDLGNGKACACPGPFHIPRPVVPQMTSGMIVVNCLLVIVTGGLWGLFLLFHLFVVGFSPNRMAQSQLAWDRDHYGV